MPEHLLTVKLLPLKTGFSVLTCLCLLKLPQSVQMHKHVNLIKCIFEKKVICVFHWHTKNG